MMLISLGSLSTFCQRSACRLSSRRNSCWRCMRPQSPSWSCRKRTKLRASWPFEPLVAGRDVDRRVAGDGGVVVVLAVDVDVDAAEVVDDVDEADEVDVDEVVHRQAGERLERRDRQRRAAVGVGGVDAVGAPARDLDTQVARDRQHRDALGARVDAQQHDAVGAPLVAGHAHAPVAAQHEDVHRLVRGVRDRELLLDGLDGRAVGWVLWRPGRACSAGSRSPCRPRRRRPPR